WHRKLGSVPPASAHIERLKATGVEATGHASCEAPLVSSRNRHQHRRAHRAGDGAASAAAARNGKDLSSRISNGHKEGKPSAGSEQATKASPLSKSSYPKRSRLSAGE